jgi:transposase-like protein
MVRKKYSKELKARIALDAIKGSENDSRISIRIWGTCQSDQYLEEAVT